MYIIEKIAEYITSNNLFTKDNKILIAVSGGIDSIVLFNLLYNCGYDISIAHCNFKLRGNESDGDEHFVKELKNKFNVNIYVNAFNTLEHAELNGLSIQVAARDLRYSWFEKLKVEHGFDFIAIAHNSDDAIETFFINLSRGTGIKGLSGIKNKNGNIVRPLLFASRKEIEEYAMNNKILYREDSSNKSTKYKRNKIRHEILPLFESLNPSFRKTMINNMNHLTEIEEYYISRIKRQANEYVSKHEKKTIIDTNKLASEPNKNLILFEILHEYGFQTATIAEITENLIGESGKQFFSQNYRLVRDRQQLIITKIEENHSKRYYIEKTTNSIEKPIKLNFKSVTIKEYTLPKNHNIASFNATQIEYPLILRRWQTGDYFMPLGMDHYKKLSDFFIDQKLSLVDKENIWILCSGETIIWIVGYRIDQRYRITEETTEVLQVITSI